MSRLTLLAATLLFLCVATAHAGEKADRVLVQKSERLLLLYRDKQLIGSFRIALGAEPLGRKLQAGDQRTPEGSYRLDRKNPDSNFYKAIHISYPNAYDVDVARSRGETAGGDIMIHGQKNGFRHFAPILQRLDWTDGCIALSDGDMDKVWAAVDVDTPIEIRP